MTQRPLMSSNSLFCFFYCRFDAVDVKTLRAEAADKVAASPATDIRISLEEVKKQFYWRVTPINLRVQTEEDERFWRAFADTLAKPKPKAFPALTGHKRVISNQWKQSKIIRVPKNNRTEEKKCFTPSFFDLSLYKVSKENSVTDLYSRLIKKTFIHLKLMLRETNSNITRDWQS